MYDIQTDTAGSRWPLLKKQMLRKVRCCWLKVRMIFGNARRVVPFVDGSFCMDTHALPCRVVNQYYLFFERQSMHLVFCPKGACRSHCMVYKQLQVQLLHVLFGNGPP